MSVQPEFSRPVRLDQLARHADTVTIRADEAERAALAKRFNLTALDQLEADYALREEAGGIMARGRVRASLAQPCVATGVPVPETIDTDFVLRFVPEDMSLAEGEELELDAEDCDTIGYSGQTIDMGEAVAETVALAMTPYPRSPDADVYLKQAGVLSEEEASPFAALLSLKDKKP
ncbi:YceD family protein [Sphingobium ummariense]